MEKRDAAPTRLPNPAMSYREDCWSEGETSVLVDAWGDRYIESTAGTSGRSNGRKSPTPLTPAAAPAADRLAPTSSARTGSTRSRRHTRSRSPRLPTGARASGPSSPASMVSLDLPQRRTPRSNLCRHRRSLFRRLCIGKAPPLHRKGSALAVASAVRLAETKNKRSAAASTSVGNTFLRRAAAAAAAVAADDDDDAEQEEEEGSGSLSRSSSRSGRGLKREREEVSSGIRELAKAIMKFAEIYERVEESKQRQMIELEKQRMEFAKALEFQKMLIIVDSQVQLAKIKRSKRSHTDSFL